MTSPVDDVIRGTDWRSGGVFAGRGPSRQRRTPIDGPHCGASSGQATPGRAVIDANVCEWAPR